MRRKVLVLLLRTLTAAILYRLASCTVFANFLENKSNLNKKNYTAFINTSDHGVSLSERRRKRNQFSSMCHVFVISRGKRGHFLLTFGWTTRRLLMRTDISLIIHFILVCVLFSKLQTRLRIQKIQDSLWPFLKQCWVELLWMRVNFKLCGVEKRAHDKEKIADDICLFDSTWMLAFVKFGQRC